MWHGAWGMGVDRLVGRREAEGELKPQCISHGL